GTDLGPGPLTDREPVWGRGLALVVPLAQVEVDLYAHRFLLSSNAALSASSGGSSRRTPVRAGRPSCSGRCGRSPAAGPARIRTPGAGPRRSPGSGAARTQRPRNRVGRHRTGSRATA